MKSSDKTEIRVIKNGPLQVSGNFVLKGTGGSVIKTEDRAFLCRCGGSKNKPFCDGSHRRVGLND